MMTSNLHPNPTCDRTWQVRLLVLTLLVSLLLGSMWGLLTGFLMFREGVGWLGVGMALSQLVIDLFLLIPLVRRHENVFLWVTIRAIGFMLLWGVAIIFTFGDLYESLVWLLLVSGISLPMLLLTAGNPGRWRKLLAVLILVGWGLVSTLFVIMIVAMILYVD